LNLPRTELANEAQDTRRSSHTEQQCKVAVGNRGEVGRRMHDGGGATYAQPEAAVARRRPQQRSDGGATEAATRAGRWRDGGCFLFDGGATVAASFSPAVRWRSKTGDPNFVDGGAIGDGEGDGEVADGGHGGGSLREREDDEQ